MMKIQGINFTTKTTRFEFGLKQIQIFADGWLIKVVGSKEEVKEEIDFYLEVQNEKKALAAQGKQEYNSDEMFELFVDHMKRNNIAFEVDCALTGSRYVRVNGKNLRFSDHERPYNSKWNYLKSDSKNFPIGWFSEDELDKLFEQYSS